MGSVVRVQISRIRVGELPGDHGLDIVGEGQLGGDQHAGVVERAIMIGFREHMNEQAKVVEGFATGAADDSSEDTSSDSSKDT